MIDRIAILHAYRRLYRHALEATQYATPARHVIRDTMRHAFRTEPAQNFSPQKVNNTLEFLKRAQQEAGIEHRLLKHLLIVRNWQRTAIKGRNPCVCRMMLDPSQDADYTCRMAKQTTIASRIRKERWAQYDATLTMFNDSEDLCLR